MSANSITLIRIMLSVVVVVMFGMNLAWRMAAVVLTFIVFYMDSLKGYVALKLGVASDFGAYQYCPAKRVENCEMELKRSS